MKVRSRGHRHPSAGGSSRAHDDRWSTGGLPGHLQEASPSVNLLVILYVLFIIAATIAGITIAAAIPASDINVLEFFILCHSVPFCAVPVILVVILVILAIILENP